MGSAIEETFRSPQRTGNPRQQEKKRKKQNEIERENVSLFKLSFSNCRAGD